MGLLRLFFALGVVIVHSYSVFGYRVVNSTVAVNSFFIISGFYMALILHEKYIGKKSSYRLFLGNRFLRIFPLYWVILLLLFSFSFTKFAILPTQENALKIFLDFAGSSSDFSGNAIMTLLRNTTLIFTTDYFYQNFKDPGHLLLLPAWTLQIEVLFYLIAPFIAKLRVFFLILLAVPFGLITFSNILPIFHSDLSITYIFLGEFVFFILGMISYELYKLVKKVRIFKDYSLIIFVLILTVIFIYGYFSAVDWLPLFKNTHLFYYLFLSLSIPFVFNFSKSKPFDTTFGDLSYPVYLSHMLVFKVITNSHLFQDNHSVIALLTLASTLIFSFILVKTIEKPVDILRNKRFRSGDAYGKRRKGDIIRSNEGFNK